MYSIHNYKVSYCALCPSRTGQQDNATRSKHGRPKFGLAPRCFPEDDEWPHKHKLPEARSKAAAARPGQKSVHSNQRSLSLLSLLPPHLLPTYSRRPRANRRPSRLHTQSTHLLHILPHHQQWLTTRTETPPWRRTPPTPRAASSPSPRARARLSPASRT